MEKDSRYGKSGIFKWVVLYVVVGLVVYYALFAIFKNQHGIRKKTSFPSEKPTTTSMVPATIKQEITVKLNEENNSGQAGTAILKEEEGKTTVTLALTGALGTAPQPAHIHRGFCPGVGAVKYALSNVINGDSITVLPVNLSQLKGDLPLAINVHKSALEITNYTSCGQINF